MTLKPLGDAAWLVEFPGVSGGAALARVTGLVEALRHPRPAGVVDVVPSFDSLAVRFETADPLEVREWILSVNAEERLPEGAELQIPVCYGGDNGPDLEEVAAAAGLTPDEVVAIHSGATYTVAAVGFSPGFPYLTGLPERLRVPRRRTPRMAVPGGSVAIAGGQAGIYPFTSPGGWQLLGRTAVTLFDPFSTRPSLLVPGDRVRFVPVADQALTTTPHTPPPEPEGRSWIRVIEPGGLTTVQDLGRPGHEGSGVSPGGAADRHALRMANLLVGNDEGAAALELCVRGPVLEFHGATTAALTESSGRPRRVADGETVDFSILPGGVRACLAVAGGILVPMVLGSASTDLRAGFGGFGGRALKAGDRLEVGEPGPVPQPGDWHAGRVENFRVSEIELRFIAGVQEPWFTREARRRLRETTYLLTPGSDRMGARLAGEELELAEAREMISQPVACGSIQVPPDGQPIILLAERQTIGGYPQIGHVISVDLPKLARAWPGTFLKFREVTLETAWALRREEERNFNRLRNGLNLLK